MRSSRTLFRTTGLLTLVLVVMLSATGIAAAQASPQYDLGCWGVVTAGGDLRTIRDVNTNRIRRTLIDSAGNWTAGETSSTNYVVHGGYTPAYGSGATGLAASPVQANAGFEVYLPVFNNSVTVVYLCQF